MTQIPDLLLGYSLALFCFVAAAFVIKVAYEVQWRRLVERRYQDQKFCRCKHGVEDTFRGRAK